MSRLVRCKGIARGSVHNFLLPIHRQMGSVFTMGSGFYQALGSDSFSDLQKFKLVEGLKSADVRSIYAGYVHSTALTKDGALFVFGRPFEFSKTGRFEKLFSMWSALSKFMSKRADKLIPEDSMYLNPAICRGLETVQVSHVRTTAGLTLTVDEVGTVSSFGVNRHRQCGYDLPKGKLHSMYPERVPYLPPIVCIDVGFQHVLALSDDGEIYVWGKVKNGRLGLNIDPESVNEGVLPRKLNVQVGTEATGKIVTIRGKEKERFRPVHVKFKYLAAGFSHSAAITTQNELYVWGKCLSLSLEEKKEFGG